MAENEAILSAHAVDLIDSRGQVVSRHSQGIEKDHVVEPLSGDPWVNYFGFTLLFRRNLLDVIPFSQRGESTYAFGSSLSHDRWVCTLAQSLGRIVLIEEPLASYRQHDAQLFGAHGRQGSSLGRVANGALHAREKLDALQREQATLARVCHHRSALFASAQPSPSFTRDELNRASAFWSRLGDRHACRVNVHQAGTLRGRVRALSAGLRRGQYSSENFGHRSLVKDLGVCLLGPSSGPRRTE